MKKIAFLIGLILATNVYAEDSLGDRTNTTSPTSITNNNNVATTVNNTVSTVQNLQNTVNSNNTNSNTNTNTNNNSNISDAVASGGYSVSNANSASNAAGGSVSNSGNSSSTSNAVGGSVGNVTATAGSSTSNSNSTVGNVTASTGASTSSATGGSSNSSASNNGNGSNNTTITQNYESHRAPVQTAYAAGLTSGIDTCLGSASGGVQTQFFGLSLGGTKVDQNCVHIKNAHLIAEFDKTAACNYILANVAGAKDSGLKCDPPAPQVMVIEKVITKEVPVIVKEIVKEVIIHPNMTEPAATVAKHKNHKKQSEVIAKVEPK